MSRNTPATLELRVAVPDDVAGILALISRAYPGIENYSAGQISGQINNFPEGQFVAVRRGGRRLLRLFANRRGDRAGAA